MAKMGRPEKQIDWDQFDKLCALQCTLNEMALWFECSVDTLQNRVNSTWGMTFSAYYSQKAEKGRVSLRRKMWEMALKGDRVMLIWLSKQHLGMTEKVEQKTESNSTTQVQLVPAMTKEDAKKILEDLKQKEKIGESNETSNRN